MVDLNAYSDPLGLPREVAGVLLVLLVGLLAATAFRGFRLFLRPGTGVRRSLKSLLTWWVLFILFLATILLGPRAVTLGMLAVALLGLREGLSLSASRALFPILGLAVLALFVWGWLARTPFFIGVLPVLLFLLAMAEGFRRVVFPGRLREAPWMAMGVLLPVLGPLSVVAVATVRTPGESSGSWEGWLVLLVILTELNDMAQAWWGKALGSRPLAPDVSPSKSWEGLWGGMVTTILAAVVFGPILSPVGRVPPTGVGGPAWIWPIGLGILMAWAGIGGDLAASLLKRHRGVKDAGDLLPAQGGVLDRFDSLALSGPVFFFLTWFFWIRPQ